MSDSAPLPRLHKRLHRRLKSAITSFTLIERGDKILLGLSGGKDSLALLRLLGERMAHSGGFFTIVAAHVRMEGIEYESDTNYLAREAEAFAIPFHVLTANFPTDRRPDRAPCFLCARNRRKALFEFAQAIGCTKIALGHHRDDIVRTALMNLTLNGSFSTMPARLDFRKMPLSIIRPLAMTSEDDLREYARLCRFQPMRHSCPFEKATVRTSIEGMLLEMERLTPSYRENVFHALLKQGLLIEERESLL